mmetsp:Transcript_22304/g.73331  ORF Transcript_22304/g.73331 Transcript_22304/m.73331 type:complete len:289 (+) Transcript_22304:191-1057(+)
MDVGFSEITMAASEAKLESRRELLAPPPPAPSAERISCKPSSSSKFSSQRIASRSSLAVKLNISDAIASESSSSAVTKSFSSSTSLWAVSTRSFTLIGCFLQSPLTNASGASSCSCCSCSLAISLCSARSENENETVLLLLSTVSSMASESKLPTPSPPVDAFHTLLSLAEPPRTCSRVCRRESKDAVREGGGRCCVHAVRKERKQRKNARNAPAPVMPSYCRPLLSAMPGHRLSTQHGSPHGHALQIAEIAAHMSSMSEQCPQLFLNELNPLPPVNARKSSCRHVQT